MPEMDYLCHSNEQSIPLPCLLCSSPLELATKTGRHSGDYELAKKSQQVPPLQQQAESAPLAYSAP